MASAFWRPWIVAKTLAKGKGRFVRKGPEEARVQNDEVTNRNSIKGLVPGQVGTTPQHPGFKGQSKCCACVVKVHVLIRGDLPGKQSLGGLSEASLRRLAYQKSWHSGPLSVWVSESGSTTTAKAKAHFAAMQGVTGQKSADAIVAKGLP